MNVSPNFTLAEFARSETAARMGREIVIPEVVVPNIIRLATSVLEPLRRSVGPLLVLSGYRPLWLNDAVGGAPTSAHMDGRAADLLSHTLTPRQLAGEVLALGLAFDQCILEFGQWTHVAVAPDGAVPRRQALTALSIAGRTQYLAGLVETVEPGNA